MHLSATVRPHGHCGIGEAETNSGVTALRRPTMRAINRRRPRTTRERTTAAGQTFFCLPDQRHRLVGPPGSALYRDWRPGVATKVCPQGEQKAAVETITVAAALHTADFIRPL